MLCLKQISESSNTAVSQTICVRWLLETEDSPKNVTEARTTFANLDLDEISQLDSSQ